MSPQRSSIATEAGEAVLHYKRKLTRHLEDESPDIVLHCLDKLELIPVNINILQETGIGKVVNHLKKSGSADESVIDKARAIVSKWKEIVANEEQALSQQNETEDLPDEKSDDQDDSGSEGSDHADSDHADSEPPFLVPETELPPPPPPISKLKEHVSKSSSSHSKVTEESSSKKSKREEESSSSSRSKSSSKDKERSSAKDSSSSSSKHRSHEDSSSGSSSSKKKKKDKERDKDKEREKEKGKRSSSSTGGEEKKGKREKEEESSKNRKRKHESSLSEDESEKAKKRKHEATDRKHHNSSEEKSKHKSSSSSKKPVVETNGFEAALSCSTKSSSSSDKKESKKKSSQSSSTAEITKTNKDRFEEPKPLPPAPLSVVPSDLNPNYQPAKAKAVNLQAPAAALNQYSHLTDGKTDDEALSALISMSKNAKRTAVYSGSKRSAFASGKFPKLSELCVHKLQEDLTVIEDCHGLEFKVLEPVLERAKPETLIHIEDHNPYLMENTGNLWERICKKQFPKEKRQEYEAWRELYERCTTDRKKKLDFLSERLNNSYKNVKDNHRKTKLAYVDGVAKAPRNFQRAQDKNGTGVVVSSHMPVRKMGGGGGPPQPSRPAREGGSSGASGSSGGPPAASKKPKMAPMMAKTLKMVRGLKVNFRR